jgi:cyclic pyranopterin phosphate synthase
LNDPSLEISSIRLIDKKGGKSDRSKFFIESQKAAILVCSDSTFEGKSKDKSGLLIKELLGKYNTTIVEYNIVSDEPSGIKEQIIKYGK